MVAIILSPTVHKPNNLGNKENVEQIQNLKQQKEILEHGILLFNQKPKKGLEFLQKHALVGTKPKDIADFLNKEDGR